MLHAEFDRDGARVVTASRDNTAQLWDWGKSQRLGAPMAHISTVNAARFSPDGRWVLTASDDGVTRLWPAEEGAPGAQAIRSARPITDAMFSEDGRLILSITDRGPGILLAPLGGLEAEPFSAAAPIAGATGSTMAISSADADMFATAHNAEVMFADATDDGRLVATGSADRTARIWSRRTRRPTIEPLVHDATVNCVRFNADGTLLVTSTINGKVRVWDSQSGQPITDWLLSKDPVSQVWIDTRNAHVVTAEGTIWRIHFANSKAPPWLPDLAESVAGIRYVQRNILEPVPGSAIFNLRSNVKIDCDHSQCKWRDFLHELPSLRSK